MSEDEPFSGAVLDADPLGGRDERDDRSRSPPPDEEGGLYRRVIDSQTESVGMAVISAVAAVSDTDPKRMEPLHHVLDIDALEALFQPGSDGRVTFPYNGYEVVVRSDEVITVTPIPEERWSKKWTRIVDSPFHETCAHCGAVHNSGDWYPVVTTTAEDGDTALYSFCDEGCQTAWEPE